VHVAGEREPTWGYCERRADIFDFPPTHLADPNRVKKRVSGRSSSPPLGHQITQTLGPIQKCDAKRPCTTCIAARTTSECVYDNEKHLQPAGTYPSHKADGHLFEIPTGRLPHSPGDDKFGDVPSPAKLDRIPSKSSEATWIVTNDPAALQIFRDGQVPHGELVLAHRNPLEKRAPLDTSLPFFTVPFFSLPTIPREPWISLSFFGGEKLQVQISEMAATDLAMKACVLEQKSIDGKLTLRY
jgi:hypothetical protein